MAPFIEQIRAELVAITDRIAAAFNEAADKWTTEKHLTLEAMATDRPDAVSPRAP